MTLKQVELTDLEKDYLNHIGLLAICQELHMSMTGAGDLLPLERVNKFYTWVCYKLDNWKDSSKHSTYDLAIRQLVTITRDDLVLWFKAHGERYYGDVK